MDSIGDLLVRKDFDEPSEVVSLREFVRTEYQINPTIRLSTQHLTLYMPNASLVNLLRMRYPEIQRRCQLTRKLYIRVG